RSSLTSRPRVLVGAVASVLAFNASSEAAVFLWNNSAGGSYSTSANWTPLGPPGSADTARFNINNTYTVNFTTSPAVSVLDESAGAVTFAASGASRTYTVTTATLHGGDLLVTGGGAFAFDLSLGTMNVNTDSHLTFNLDGSGHFLNMNLGTVSGA